VAAVFAEPIQGEAGLRPLSADYLRALRRLTREHGTLLILDEVQTGMGRTGNWFAHQAVPDVQPDVMTLAKGLGGGFPIGAVIAFGAATHDLLRPGQHGTTFGGNPLAAAVGLAVIGTMIDEELLQHTRRVGDQLAQAITALADPRISGVRGEGLLRGIALTEPIAPAPRAGRRAAAPGAHGVGRPRRRRGARRGPAARHRPDRPDRAGRGHRRARGWLHPQCPGSEHTPPGPAADHHRGRAGHVHSGPARPDRCRRSRHRRRSSLRWPVTSCAMTTSPPQSRSRSWHWPWRWRATASPTSPWSVRGPSRSCSTSPPPAPVSPSSPASPSSAAARWCSRRPPASWAA